MSPKKEPETAYVVNGLAVRNMAIACRQVDAKLVHFSTDYVFDGTPGRAYTEDDPTHPLGAYAVSKLAGELYARAYLDHVLIIRTSGVYGPGGLDTARGNFVELMLRLAASAQPIRVVEDHVASPTFAPALASRSADLVERGVWGIVHIGGGTPISWFDWAVKIFDAGRIDSRHSSAPTSANSAPRRGGRNIRLCRTLSFIRWASSRCLRWTRPSACIWRRAACELHRSGRRR